MPPPLVYIVGLLPLRRSTTSSTVAFVGDVTLEEEIEPVAWAISASSNTDCVDGERRSRPAWCPLPPSGAFRVVDMCSLRS